jgi:ribonuclease BN (tRNA processing enzyme)
VGLTLTVLGCSGSYAAPGNACSGYLVRSGDTSVWLDTGPGTLSELQRHVSLPDLTGIVVTHEHPDHWVELPVARNALRFGSRREGVPVHSTAGVHRLCEAIVEDGTEPTFSWTEVSDGSCTSVGPMTFTFSRTDHPVETLAVRVDADGRSLGYSADTGPEWSPAALGSDVDLLLCEATLVASEEGEVQHLSGRQAGRLAREAGIPRLLLTHVWPESDPEAHGREAEESFGSAVEVAAVGRSYEV